MFRSIYMKQCEYHCEVFFTFFKKVGTFGATSTPVNHVYDTANDGKSLRSTMRKMAPHSASVVPVF